ncbi:MAG: protease modulator HflC [Thermoanaerobaculia bacterium]
MKKTTLAFLLVGAIVALALDSLVIVDETEVALATRFGRLVSGPLAPGPHLILPRPIGSVFRLDRRRILFRIPPTEFLTSDKKNLVLELSLLWRISDPALFLQRVRDVDGAEARLIDLAISSLGSAAGRMPSEAFFSTQPGTVRTAELTERVRQRVDAFARASLGVEADAAWLSQVHFPGQNREAIVARMRAERARIALRLRSEGEEAGQKIEAEADERRRTLLAEAARDAEILRGQGEAEATRLVGEAYRRDPRLYEFLRALHGYEKSIGAETTIFLDSKSPMLKVLNEGPGTGAHHP